MRPNWLSTTPAQKKPRICSSIWGARRVSTGRASGGGGSGGGGEEDGGEILHWAGLDDAEGGDDEDRDAEEGERVEAQVVDHLDGAAGQVHVHPRARRPEAGAAPPPPPLPPGRPVPGRPTHAAEDAAGRRRGGRGRGAGPEEDVVPCQRRRRRRSGSRRHGAKAGGARAEATGAERLAGARGCRVRVHTRTTGGRGDAAPCRVPARARGVPFIWLRAGPGELGGELGGWIRCRGDRSAARAFVRLSLPPGPAVDVAASAVTSSVAVHGSTPSDSFSKK